jgi:hypothetical protein
LIQGFNNRRIDAMRKSSRTRGVLIVTRNNVCSSVKALLMCLLLAVSAGAYASQRPTLKVDGVTLPTDPPPVVRHGRMYVPITAFRKIGLYVDYKPGSSTGTVAWLDSDSIYDLAAGQSWVPGQVRGSREEIPGTPFMLSGQLMVPLRTPFHGGDILEWDAKNRVANVVRSTPWLRWRLAEDSELKAAHPRFYETPITDTLSYYENGTYKTVKLSKQKATEAEARRGGHMPWREDPLLVAVAMTKNLLPPVKKGEKSETETSMLSGKPVMSVITSSWRADYAVKTNTGTRATINLVMNGKQSHRLTLSRPFGHWYYVTYVER